MFCRSELPSTRRVTGESSGGTVVGAALVALGPGVVTLGAVRGGAGRLGDAAGSGAGRDEQQRDQPAEHGG